MLFPPPPTPSPTPLTPLDFLSQWVWAEFCIEIGGGLGHQLGNILQGLSAELELLQPGGLDGGILEQLLEYKSSLLQNQREFRNNLQLYRGEGGGQSRLEQGGRLIGAYLGPQISVEGTEEDGLPRGWDIAGLKVGLEWVQPLRKVYWRGKVVWSYQAGVLSWSLEPPPRTPLTPEWSTPLDNLLAFLGVEIHLFPNRVQMRAVEHVGESGEFWIDMQESGR